MLATRVPWTRLTLVALVAAAAPAAIAFEAWRATRRHRDAAERALRDYAGSAAIAFRDQYISRLYFAVDGIFEPVVGGAIAARADVLPGPGVLRLAAEAMRPCDACGAVLRPGNFFRLTLADSGLSIEGPPLRPERRAELIARMPAFDPDLPPRWYTSSGHLRAGT
jgi:hypothetical protein